MAAYRMYPKTGCDVEVTQAVIGGLWAPVLLWHLMDGRKRFCELCRLVPNATQRMVTLALRELEAHGMITRHVFPEVPPRVEYEVTPLGTTLRPVLVAMRDWGAAFRQTRLQGVTAAE